MILPTLKLDIERWKFNKEYNIYVLNKGHFKDANKQVLPVKVNESGYCCIKTSRDYRLAHRLVMCTWVPLLDAENLTVDHLDHNKRNNVLSNLEWVSYEENQRRARRDACNSESKVCFTKNDCKLSNAVNEKTIVHIYHYRDCTRERIDEKFITIKDFVAQIRNDNPENYGVTIKYIINLIEEGRERNRNKIKIFGWWVKIK